MATSEQENTEREALQETLDELCEFKAEDLVRDRDLGRALNFSSGLPYFERLLKLYRDISACSLDGLPYGALNQLKSHAVAARDLLKRVMDFDANQANPAVVRDQLVNQVRDVYDAHYNLITPRIAYSVRKGTDFEALEKDARASVATIRSEVAGLRVEGEKLRNEANSVLSAMREVAGKVGVAHHATSFQTEAAEHSREADKWLRWTAGFAGLGLLTLIALFVFPFHPESSGMDTGKWIYAVVSRLLAFSVVYSAIFWAAKNFLAHRHNYIVNKHRQNALATFETFIKAAGDDKDIKSAVLLHASQCIYSPQASGYLAGEPPPQVVPNVLEVVKQTVSSGGK